MNLYFAISTLHLKFPTGQDMNFFFLFSLYFKVNVALFFSFFFSTNYLPLFPPPPHTHFQSIEGSYDSLGRQLINLQYSKTNPENR